MMGKVAVSLEYVLQQQLHGATSIDLPGAVALVSAVTDNAQTVLAGTAQAETLVTDPPNQSLALGPSLGPTNDQAALVAPDNGTANDGAMVTSLGLTSQQQVAALYLGLIARVVDVPGFNYWVGQLNQTLLQENGQDAFSDIASAFASSGEATALSPLLNGSAPATDAQIEAFVKGVYGRLFDRTADDGGLAYWTGQIKQALANGQPVQPIVGEIISGAQSDPSGQDMSTLLAKISASIAYVQEQQGAVPDLTGNNVLSPEDQAGGWQFIGGTGGGQNFVVPTGADIIVPSFNPAAGDRLDLSQVLSGAPLAQDLTNIGDFIKVLGYGPTDSGFGQGTKSMFEIVGPNGTSLVTLEGSGKLAVDDLVKSDSLILPPH
jgi:hypothetical protein